MNWRYGQQCLVTTALIACVAAPCAAQQTIEGRVVTETSQRPIASAHLSLVDDSGHVVARAVTDSALGAFYLDAPRRGRYAVNIVIGHGGLSRSPFFDLDSNQVVERTFAIPNWPQAVLDAYLADDVTKPAFMLPGERPPIRYPDGARQQGRRGLVRVTFVVDQSGRADMNTFRVLESDDDRFTDAVHEMVSRGRYSPAERNGTIVSQVYEQVVDFGCTDDPLRASGKTVISVRIGGCPRR